MRASRSGRLGGHLGHREQHSGGGSDGYDTKSAHAPVNDDVAAPVTAF
ncbi:hypothetical protein [Streptomyces sp. NBC_00342]|nr:hypothetical protein [Streptomyces sp. NBC_00342]